MRRLARTTAHEDLSWQDDRACRGLDPAIFWPETVDAVDRAKAICQPCTARTACLEYALFWREQDGIWGGTTGSERKLIVRNRRRQAAATS